MVVRDREIHIEKEKTEGEKKRTRDKHRETVKYSERKRRRQIGHASDSTHLSLASCQAQHATSAEEDGIVAENGAHKGQPMKSGGGERVR